MMDFDIVESLDQQSRTVITVYSKDEAHHVLAVFIGESATHKLNEWIRKRAYVTLFESRGNTYDHHD